jgi:hypothetical protein
MRVIDKIKHLEIGDTVVVYMEFSHRYRPRECQITKIGRQYLYAGGLKFSKESGGAEFGYQVFPGTLDEYNKWLNIQERARQLSSTLSRKIYQFSEEELDIIEALLNR